MPAAPWRASVSRVTYGAFLAYSPKGQLETSVNSRRICYQIKQDGSSATPGLRMIEYAVGRLTKEATPELLELLAADATLVPVPRSAPFPPRAANVLWVPDRICGALLAAGLGAAVVPALRRVTVVAKSAFAPRGYRPGVQEHVDSMQVQRTVIAPEKIVLVDDVVTRGATLLAAAALVRQAYPRADVRAFALVRTCGLVTDVLKIVDPVVGILSTDRWGGPHREP